MNSNNPRGSMKTPSPVLGNNCRKCNQLLTENNMYLTFYKGNICKECIQKEGRIKSAKYRDNNYELYREKSRTASTKYYAKIKQQLFDGYGNECACPACDEDEPLFLTIDHVNNDGHLERGSRKKLNSNSYGINLYKRIISEGFPERYQLLCMNCNFGKRMNNGVCPHITRKGLETIPSGSTAKWSEAHCS